MTHNDYAVGSPKMSSKCGPGRLVQLLEFVTCSNHFILYLSVK